MKQRILSIFLTLSLCIFSQSVTYAQQEAPSLQADALTEVSTSGLVAHDSDSIIPTPTEVYSAMIALKEQDKYKEGTTWTDDEPYSGSNGYYWNGGLINGDRISATGCAAFAFILSDAAFGSLPNRMFAAGGFSYEDIKVGDILRMNNDTHTVIVLEVNEAGVVIAEGNNGGKVHWGRTISKEEVMNNASHYLTRYPEGYIAPDDPTANDIIEDGTIDGGLTWKLTKAGTMTISGSGPMPDDFSSPGDQPWNYCSDKIRTVVIEDGITSISPCAFWGCGALSAKIPASVTTIGNYAFYQSSIISVSIPSSVKTIGDSAFRSCQNLSSITVSEGVETIGQNAFYGCTSLTSIALPASIKEVGSGAFFQCQAMTSATFAPGSKQVTLGDNLFTQCYNLMSVTLPKSIDCIGEGMFQNCGMLTGVIIPQGAVSIGTWAFASSGVSVVMIPDSVTTIGSAAFSACPLSEIYYTGTEAQWNSIGKIGDTAAAVSKVTMHYNYIPTTTPDPDDDNNGDNSGNGNGSGNGSGSENDGNSGNGGSSGNGNGSGNGGGSENDGDSGNGGGSGNGNGSGNGGGSEDDGDSGNGNGSGNGGGSGNGNGSGNGGDSGNDDKQAPLAKGETFMIGKVTYKVTKVSEEVELVTSKSTTAKVTINTVTGTDNVTYKVTSIGSKAMQNNKKVSSLTIGANVKTIGANAFSGCTKLAKVSFGKSVTSIGTSAFKGCTALKKTLTLPDSVKTIGASAFSGCNKITAVTIGKTAKSNLTSIGKSAFNGCKKLGKVTIKSTKLSSAGKQAFKGTASSLKVKVPSKQLAKYKKLLKKAGLQLKQVTK